MNLDRRGLLMAGASLAASPLLVNSAKDMGGGIFGGMSQADLDRAYDQRFWADNIDEVLTRFSTTSADVVRRMPPVTQRYGQSAEQAVDIFAPPGAKGAPVYVIIHGGAWRPLKRELYFGPAPVIVGAGCICVVVGFDSIPAVSVAGMAAQIGEALRWIARNIARFGGDGANIHLIGSSSGAHLGGVALTQVAGLRGATLLSGMYDLYPVMLSSRRDYVHLSEAEVAALSPMRHLDRITATVTVGWGEKESPEFKRQSSVFAAALQGMGRLDQSVVVPGRNHFEMFEQLYTADTPLMAATLARARS